MIDKALEVALLNLGFTKSNQQFYGVYGGYLVTVKGAGRKLDTFINFYTKEPKDAVTEGDLISLTFFELSESIKPKLEQFNITDYSSGLKGLEVKSNSSIDIYLEMLDFLIDKVKDASLSGTAHCSNCGILFKKKLPKKVLLESKNYLYCDSCAINLFEEKEALRDIGPIEDAGKGNIIYRLLGSLAGGIIGALLLFSLYNWLLPAFSSDFGFDIRYLFTISGFIVAFLIYKGYYLKNESTSNFDYLFLPFLTVLFSFIGQYIGTLAFILRENSLKFTQIIEYKNLLFMPFRSTATGSSPSYNTTFYLFLGLTCVLGLISILMLLSNTKAKTRYIEMPKIETLKIASDKE